MAIKVITDFGVLLRKAHRLGKAKSVKNPNLSQKAEIEKAKLDHDTYRDICLGGDKMTI